MKGEIARFKDQLVLKKRELEGIKLVRRELSEAELTGKVQQIEEICTQLREESVILMRKYPGYREKEGIDAEDNQRYRFGNAVLSEYDELQEELTETLKRVIALKAKKLKDKEVRMEQIEKCKEDQMALDGQIAELDTKIDELEADKKRRERYQGEDLGKVKEERESLMHEYAELDKALKELVKDKNAASTFQSKGQSELRNAFEERQKEYERLCRKRRLEEAAAEEEEQLQAQEKPEELTKTESFRAVRSSQVEGCVAVIQRRLALRGVDADQAFALLLANDELAQDPDNMFVTLGSIESSLRKDPFFVPKKDVRMLARYLVEDNSQEMIEFRSDRTQAKIIVKSIFKTLLGHIPKRSPEQLMTAFKKIREAILANKDQLLSNLLTIEKKDTLSSQKFGEGIRNVPPNLLELDENLKNLLVMHCIERFEPEDIKIPMLPEIFGEKEITERYIRSSKTKPTQSIASSSVQAPDTKPAVVPEASKGAKGVANTVTAPTQVANKPTQGKQMVIDSEGEMDSEDDISREEFTPVAQGPPPSLVVNKVDTFNNPETKSRILSLEQIKAASEVKGAFGKLMFGGVAKPAGQEAGETKPAEEKKPAANPLSFILGGNKKGAEGASSPKDSTPKATDKQVVVPPKPAPVQPADAPAKPSKPAVIFDDEYDEDEEIENMLSKNKNTTKD